MLLFFSFYLLFVLCSHYYFYVLFLLTRLLLFYSCFIQIGPVLSPDVPNPFKPKTLAGLSILNPNLLLPSPTYHKP